MGHSAASFWTWTAVCRREHHFRASNHLVTLYNSWSHSTHEEWRAQAIDVQEKSGVPCRIRTYDPLIKSYRAFVYYQWVKRYCTTVLYN